MNLVFGVFCFRYQWLFVLGNQHVPGRCRACSFFSTLALHEYIYLGAALAGLAVRIHYTFVYMRPPCVHSCSTLVRCWDVASRGIMMSSIDQRPRGRFRIPRGGHLQTTEKTAARIGHHARPRQASATAPLDDMCGSSEAVRGWKSRPVAVYASSLCMRMWLVNYLHLHLHVSNEAMAGLVCAIKEVETTAGSSDDPDGFQKTRAQERWP